MNGLFVAPLINNQHIKNIGDYIQSIAQEQYWDSIDCYVEREKLASFHSDEKVNLIMQGWFMWDYTQFPPSDSINPFFISFHLTPIIANKLLTLKNIEYFKKFEPIGCRDYNTKTILESKGIKCYYSGCLTLTLDLKYKSTKQDKYTYIVDPYIPIGGSKDISKIQRIRNLFLAIIKHITKVNIILNIKEKLFNSRSYRNKSLLGKIKEVLTAISFYDICSQAFTDEILVNSIYLTHLIDERGLSEDDKLNMARQYIDKYAKAKLIITSRIHAALPALSLGTPVIFITSDFLSNTHRKSAPGGRFGGIIELLNCLELKGNKLYGNNDYMKNLLNNKIGTNTIIHNPDTYKPIRQKLIEKTFEFINKCKNN